MKYKKTKVFFSLSFHLHPNQRKKEPRNKEFQVYIKVISIVNNRKGWDCHESLHKHVKYSCSIFKGLI